MTLRRCVACGDDFNPRPQVPQQAFCGKAECRRERRRIWQRKKRQSDPDYVRNQARAQQAWLQRHPDYWRDYRSKHPAYVERNRALQKTRNSTPRPDVAKMASRLAPDFLEPGIYQLRPISANGVAKKDGWTVQLRILSRNPLP